MAFVGRQVHVDQLRYVVIELGRGASDPGYLGQITTHAPTVGILLCTGCDEAIVRYALSGAGAPVAMATHDTLPLDQRAGLPDPDGLTAALTDALNTSSDDHDEPPAAPVASPRA